MSGIANETARYVKAIEGTKARLLDSRKTTPGLRMLEKHAVACGGGLNHRLGLDNGVMIKDNHIAVCGSIKAAVERARKKLPVLTKIEVECDRLDQVAEALETDVDVIMLDNMSVADMRRRSRWWRPCKGGSVGRHPARHDPCHRGDRRRLHLDQQDHAGGAVRRHRPRRRRVSAMAGDGRVFLRGRPERGRQGHAYRRRAGRRSRGAAISFSRRAPLRGRPARPANPMSVSPMTSSLRLERAQRFLITWDAHGLRYGLPVELKDAARGGPPCDREWLACGDPVAVSAVCRSWS